MTDLRQAERFVDCLLPAFEQAAAIATSLQGRVANQPKSGEQSEVKAALTVADTAVQEALLVPLLAEFRDALLEAEEDTASVPLFSAREDAARIVIDPIDGTYRHYLLDEGPYSILAGLAVSARYVASLVALPKEGLLFYAVAGDGARLADLGEGWSAAHPRPATLARRAEDRRVLISDTTPVAVVDALRQKGLEPVLASGGAISVAPLVPGVVAGLRYARPGGETPPSISERGRVGLLVSREAGAVVARADASAFPEDIHVLEATLLVARDPEIARALAATVAAAT